MYSSVSVRSKTYRSIVSKLRRSCTHISFSSARLSACHVVNHRDSRHFHGAPLRLNLRKDDIAVETVALEHSEFESDFTASYGDSGDVSFDHLVSSSAFKCHIATYWIEQMKLLERPAAKGLIAKLLPTNPLGYEPSTGAPKKGTLLEHMISWKRQHPEQVILARVGEFYETYGVDALMLINYAGLNPMGGAARAGCPVKNVQATLDSLTQAGLSVAVFEEVSIIDTGRGSAASSKAKLKERVLSQIVSPASSTYIYNNMCLRSDDIEFRENRPAIGILRTVNGYTLCQVHLDTAVLVISERLTEEGVRSLVASSGHIEPVYLQDCSPAELSFLTHTSSSGSSTGNSGGGGGHVFEKLNGYSETDFPDQVLRRLSRRMEIEVDNIRVCNRNQLAAIQPGRQSSQHQQRQQQAAPLMPIYTSTALQIGLIANDNVPDLVPSLLPARSSAFSARFLRKWLLNPPPADIADHMRQLCSVLMGEGTTTSVTSAKSFASAEVAPKCALHSATEEDPGVEMKKHRSAPPAVPLVPRFTPLSIAKVVTLINRNQCNVALFKEIRHNLNALQVMLRSAHAYRDSLHRTTTSTTAAATTALIAPPTATTPGTTSTKTSTSTTINPSAASIYTSATGVGGVGVGDAADCSALVEPLLALTSYESGILADYDQLLQETAVVLEKIDFVIPHQDPASDEHATEGSVSIVDEPFSDPYARIPSEFFIDNEREFRNKLLPTHPDVKVIYETVDKAAKALCEVVNAQFAQGFVVQYDVNNNAIVLRNEYATGSGGGASAGGGRKRDKNIPLPTFDADRYVTFMDRKGVAIKKSYTTEAVSAALRHYIQAAAQAELQVSQVLQQLSKALQGRHLISIVQAAHWAVILESVTLHSVSARQRGWSVPKMTDFPLDKDGTIGTCSLLLLFSSILFLFFFIKHTFH